MRKLTLLYFGDPQGCRCGGSVYPVFITVPVSKETLEDYLNGIVTIDEEAERQLQSLSIDPSRIKHYVVRDIME